MTPPEAEWRGVTIRFPGEPRDAAGPFSLALAAGERVLLLGPSGSGKSSLLLALTGLIPEAIPAEVTGERRIGGADAADRRPAGWADRVAVLFQNPERNLCGMTALAEVAFALEQRGLPEAAIRERALRALADMGFDAAVAGRRAASLSGGEKQRVALAALIAQDARVLLIDEPTAHLDAPAAARLHALLGALAPGQAALVVDHRLEGLLARIDRVVALDGAGRLAAQGAPRALFRRDGARLRALGVWTPAASELDAALIAEGVTLKTPPLSVEEALEALAPDADNPRVSAALAGWLASRPPAPRPAPGAVAARLENADCRAPGGAVAVRGATLEIRAGETLALLGRNGAGKTTLAMALAGLAPLARGRRTGAAAGMTFQNPDVQFIAGSVIDELRASLPAPADDARARAALRLWGLAGLERAHPLSLSEGQKRRLALAAVDLVGDWPLLALDEPTAGLDAAAAATLTARIAAIAGGGRAVALVTHDMDLVWRVAHRAAVLEDGALIWTGSPAALFAAPDLMARAGVTAPPAFAVGRWLDRAAARC